MLPIPRWEGEGGGRESGEEVGGRRWEEGVGGGRQERWRKVERRWGKGGGQHIPTSKSME